MHLRRLFYRKIGRLCRERERLLQHLADQEDVSKFELQEVSLRLSKVSDLAEQLRMNGADEYNTHVQFSLGVSHGVCLLPAPAVMFTRISARDTMQSIYLTG